MQRLTTERGLSLVVETCLQDHEVVAVDEVDEAVLLADPASQAPASIRSGSGLPMPATGSRSASSLNRLMRLSVARSSASQ